MYLLKTDSGHPKRGLQWWTTQVNPGHSLGFDTHYSAPLVSALAWSGDQGKRSQSPLSVLDAYSVVRVIESGETRFIDRQCLVSSWEQVLASTVTEFAISGRSPTTLCVSALPGRLGRVLAVRVSKRGLGKKKPALKTEN